LKAASGSRSFEAFFEEHLENDDVDSITAFRFFAVAEMDPTV
jgi:hypothetical protein